MLLLRIINCSNKTSNSLAMASSICIANMLFAGFLCYMINYISGYEVFLVTLGILVSVAILFLGFSAIVTSVSSNIIEEQMKKALALLKEKINDLQSKIVNSLVLANSTKINTEINKVLKNNQDLLKDIENSIKNNPSKDDINKANQKIPSEYDISAEILLNIPKDKLKEMFNSNSQIPHVIDVMFANNTLLKNLKQTYPQEDTITLLYRLKPSELSSILEVYQIDLHSLIGKI